MYPVEFSCKQSIVVLILSRWLLANLSPRGANVVTAYSIQTALTDHKSNLTTSRYFKYLSGLLFKLLRLP